MVLIGFSTTENWLSRLIRWYTKASVSHTFLMFDQDGVDMVLDVDFSGYRLIPFTEFAKDNNVIYLVTPIVDIDLGLRAVRMWLGKPYDWRTFIAFHRWFRALKRHPTENPTSIICTEVAITAMRISGYPGADGLDAKGTSPQALLDFLVA